MQFTAPKLFSTTHFFLLKRKIINKLIVLIKKISIYYGTNKNARFLSPMEKKKKYAEEEPKQVHIMTFSFQANKFSTVPAKSRFRGKWLIRV